MLGGEAFVDLGDLGIEGGKALVVARPRNAQDDPPPREYDHFSHPETVSPVDRVATDNPLTFYPDEL